MGDDDFLAPPAALGFLAAAGFLAPAAFFFGDAGDLGFGDGDLLPGDAGAADGAAPDPDSSLTGDKDGAGRLEVAFLGDDAALGLAAFAFFAAGFLAAAAPFLGAAAFLADPAFLGDAGLLGDGDLAFFPGDGDRDFFGPFFAAAFLAGALAFFGGDAPPLGFESPPVAPDPDAAGAGLLTALGFAAFFGDADLLLAGDLAFAPPAAFGAFGFDGARGFRAEGCLVDRDAMEGVIIRGG